MEKERPPFFLYFFSPFSVSNSSSANPQDTGSDTQSSSSCNTEITLGSSLSTTSTETQISSASMKRKQPSSKLEKGKNRQKNWGCPLTLMLYDDPWKIKKILTQSDVDESSRLLMGKDLVEELVLPMFDYKSQWDVAKNGSSVVFWDVNDESEHRLILKLLPSTKCYVFVDGSKRNFVHRRKLKKGDEIGLHWDPYKRRFEFTVFSKACCFGKKQGDSV